MDLTQEVALLIKGRKSERVEYQAVLPPSRAVAQIICSFANTSGGFLVLGVMEGRPGLEINGLSQDFHATSITHKALDMLSPKPQIEYEYVSFEGKKLFVVKVEKSQDIIHFEAKVYVRSGNKAQLQDPPVVIFKTKGYSEIKIISVRLDGYKASSTASKYKFLDHCQSVLKIVDGLGEKLYPVDPKSPTTDAEGKVLSRILFSSFVDNFETYLSDLLYEVFLAKPETLKSNATVTVQEVLNCADIQEFVRYFAKRKLSTLQKGSVKGFIKDNKQISVLGIINELQQSEIEKVLQIRHLYSHRNGIVDEKFLQFFTGQFTLNAEHQLSCEEICNTLSFLSNVAHALDEAAILKYRLARV